MIDDIQAIRRGKKRMEQIIIDMMMTKKNYQLAYQVLMDSEPSEYIITQVGLNRKSRNYDKPYYPLFLLLREVFLEKDYSKVPLLFKQTKALSNVGRIWRRYLFDTSAEAAIKKAPLKHLLPSIFDNVSNEEEFKTASVSEMQSITNILHQIIPRYDEFYNKFESLGNKEFRKIH
jgi:hypothetical protein